MYCIYMITRDSKQLMARFHNEVFAQAGLKNLEHSEKRFPKWLRARFVMEEAEENEV